MSVNGFVNSDRRHRHHGGRSNCRQRIPTNESNLESTDEVEATVHRRKCRICHLNANGVDEDNDDEEVSEDIGEPMELGCDCKGDLGSAHKKCAVTWFLIKGDLKCEICGAMVENLFEMARNAQLEHITEVNHDIVEIQPLESAFTTGPIFELETESEHSSDAQRFVNVLLGCMVFAFLFTWLFHFKVAH